VKLKWGATTDVGMVRQQNEDDFCAEENLFVVADGMGGHNAGEVASALAISTVRSGARGGIFTADQFRELVQQANTAIYTASLDDSTQSGMGTTLTAMAVVPGEEPAVLVANVGDSRTYLFRHGVLSRVSVDHSYVQELVNEGIITPEEARVHPRRNIVTRAMGIDRNVQVDVFYQLVRTGDRVLLCSDGLVDEVPDFDIAQVLIDHSNPQEAAEALVMVANANGGRDNTTVIVVDIVDDISEPVPMPVADITTTVTPVTADATSSLPAPVVRKMLRVPVIAFWSALVFIVLSASTVLGMYARSGYFVGFDNNDNVTIYQGRVGGVLWFQPTVNTQTRLNGDDLPEDVRREVLLNRTFTSSSQAAKFLSLVETAILDASTTTVPATTTTVR
jgi:protein phosphatase